MGDGWEQVASALAQALVALEVGSELPLALPAGGWVAVGREGTARLRVELRAPDLLAGSGHWLVDDPDPGPTARALVEVLHRWGLRPDEIALLTPVLSPRGWPA